MLIRRFIGVALATVLLAVGSRDGYAIDPRALANLPSDGLLVKFRSSASTSEENHVLAAAGLRKVEAFQLVKGLSHVRPVKGETLVTTASALQSSPDIEYIEPNYLYTPDALIPNDRDFATLYGLDNTGQTGGINDADIDAPEAWEISTGGDVIIAVIDTGVDYNHPDLAGNMWSNANEIPNNGIDDDNNGYIDDVRGWDFANETNDPMDGMGHGTHVAGTIGARGNDGVGVVGVNWRVRIMPLKFMDQGIGSTSNAIRAINYAVAMGARISNNSWGGAGFSQALYDTIRAAGQAGHLFVAAAGNEGLDNDDTAGSPHYPSSYNLDNIIAVAATDDSDLRVPFSNYGRTSVDLGAPGLSINSLRPGGRYQPLSGTSMAAPFVSGVAGLLLSINPELTVAQMRQAIFQGVDPLASLSGITVTGGRLNAFNSLSSLASALSLNPMSAVLGVGESRSFGFSGGVPPYELSLSDNRVGRIDSSGLFTASAVGTTRVQIRDAFGNSLSSDNIVVAQVSVLPQTASLNVNDTLQLSASGGTPPYRWSVSDSSIASIGSSTGTLLALADGTVQVAVIDSNGISGRSGIIRVSTLSSLSVAPQTATLGINVNRQFIASGGQAPYQWSSSNPAVLEINANTGLATTRGNGSAIVNVRDALGIRASSQTISVQGLSVSLPRTSLRLNESMTVTAVGGRAPYQWRVSNSSVASVDNNGVVTALTPGSVIVTVMDADNLVGASENIQVTDNGLLQASVPAYVMQLGNTMSVNVTGGIPPLSWRVDNSAVLEVNGRSATVKALVSGSAILTISDAGGESVTLDPIEVREISVQPGVANLRVGEILAFSASGGRAPYRWEVSNSSPATINSSGLLSANSIGIITVTATDADGIVGRSGTVSIQSAAVNTNHVISVLPLKATLSLRGRGLQFTATGGLEPYTYSLSNPSVGSISANGGEFVPNRVSAGTTTVVVTDSDGHIAQSGTISIVE